MEGGKGLVVLLLGVFPVFSLFQYKNRQFLLTLQGKRNCMSVHRSSVIAHALTTSSHLLAPAVRHVLLSLN